MTRSTLRFASRVLLSATLALVLAGGAGALGAAADEGAPDARESVEAASATAAATDAEADDVVLSQAADDLLPAVVPAVTSPPLPGGQVGVAYSYRLTSNVPAATFAVSGLPAGLAYLATSARIEGTPTTAGSFSVTLQAFGPEPTDDTFVRHDVLEIADEVVTPAVITSPPLPAATVGVPFLFQLTANVSPVTFAVSGLPAGLRVDPRTGVISGTPTVDGSFAVRLQALGAKTGDTTVFVNQTFVVHPAPVVVPVITSGALPAGTVGKPYSFRVTSNVPTARFSITGLPRGLVADEVTGAVTGTPQRAGSFTVRLSAQSGKPGDTSFAVFDTLVISPAVDETDPTTPPVEAPGPGTSSPGGTAVDPVAGSIAAPGGTAVVAGSSGAGEGFLRAASAAGSASHRGALAETGKPFSGVLPITLGAALLIAAGIAACAVRLIVLREASRRD